MSEAIDYSALNWVREELNETLNRARQFLEEYAENPETADLLHDCKAQLHQVHGTLQMVEIQGAGLLALEMEAVVDALIEVRAGQPDTAMLVLMQAFIQLPDYLSRLSNGRSDVPAVLLPVINELRAARGAETLTASAVFSPDLAAPVPAAYFNPQASNDSAGAQDLARTQRQRFQAGLLEWYRGDEVSGLQKLHTVLDGLQRASRLEASARLWWLGAAVIEAIREGVLQGSIGAKQLFGQVDRQIKQLLDAGEQGFSEAVPEELVRSLLFRVSQAEGNNGRIGEVKQVYALADAGIITASDSLAGCNQELLSTVSHAAVEDLEDLKERLDVFIRGGVKEAAVLEPIATDMHALGNIISMIGLDEAARMLAGSETAVRKMSENAQAIDEPGMLAIANALVTVGEALNDVGVSEDALEQQVTADNFVYRQGLEAVIREAVADLVQSRELINEYLDSPGDREKIKDVPELLNQVRGGLQLAGQERAAAMVARVCGYIDKVVKQGEILPDAGQLDALADAICSIEYYVAELEQNRSYGGMVLDVAETSLARLDNPENPSECRNTAQSKQVMEADTGTGSTDTAILSGLQVIAGDLDEEIRSIYIEEVVGELERLADLVPRWSSGSGDRETLEIISRSFHTLKGGGRMVGAQVLGEFSWAFENLLIRVADCSIEAGKEVCELLGEAPAAVAQLLGQITTGKVPEIDINGMVTRAMELARNSRPAPDQTRGDRLAAGNSTLANVTVTDEQQADIPCTDAGSADVAVITASCDLPVLSEDADPEIVEIFLEEATEVLAVVSELLPQWIEDPDNQTVLGEVRRSFHTLKGSGRMAGAMLTGEFAWSVENLLNRVIDGSVEKTAELFTVLGQVHHSMTELVNQINKGPLPETDFRTLMVHAEKLARGDSIGPAVPPADTVAITPEPEVAAATATGNAEGAVDNESGSGDVMPDKIQATEPDVINPDTEHDSGDAELIEIFVRECRDHLNSIQSFIDDCEVSEEQCKVSESLYRALHTLSGIAESAEIASIQALAGHLYTGFSALDEAQQPVRSDVLEVLQNCKDAITVLVDKLPDITCDADWLQSLQVRINEVFQGEPQGELQPGQMVGASSRGSDDNQPMGDTQHRVATGDVADPGDRPVIDAQPEPGFAEAADESANVVDPYTDLDPELFEVFLEEADEIIEGGEMTLHSWSEEPERRDLVEAFQRQLHTLKGGARMVGIHAIGDLSHSMENLLARIVDGQVELSQRLFDLLHESHDRLAEMMARVRAHEAVAAVTELEYELNSVACDNADETRVVEAEVIAAESEVVPGSDHEDQDTAATPPEVDEQVVAQEETDTAADVPGMELAQEDAAVVPEAGVEDKTETPEPLAAGEEIEMVTATPEPLAAGEEIEMVTATPESVVVGDEAETASEVVEPAGVQVNAGTAPDAVEQIVAQAVQAAAVRQGGATQHRDERRQSAHARGEQVRVHSELLDNLVNNAGEINIYRSRLEQQIGAYRFNLAELDQTIMRLRDQLRQLEIETETQILYRHQQEGLDRNPAFDPLEMDRYSNLQQLSRSLMESISDLNSIQDLLDNTTRESETLLLQQSRVCTDLQEGLMRTRMIPFSGLAPRLRRIVRQAAQELGKKVDLKMDGADGEMDRTVIENIIAPLEHMLRNAVDHGIEDLQQRRDAGKQETGTIRITFHREGPEIVLRVADDGRGIDHEAVRKRAIERGLIAENVELSASDIPHFLLQAGFSTASEVTQISGRGVGMDVVNSEVKQLGGSLHIDSTPGQGSVFTIRLPYTLAINQALLVKAGDDTFCVPLGTIEGVVRIAQEELARSYQATDAAYEYAGNSYRLQHLGTLLNRGGVDPENTPDRVPVLLVRIGEMRAALQVEALIGHREIVVKPLGAQLSRVNGVSGATILGDGRVVFILDPAAILRMGSRVRSPGEEKRRIEKLVVMVVDDSITVRKVTTRLLERHGYNVVTAKDGMDALAQLQDFVPDMMLLDIEMPRMDGFELATHIRNDERLRHIPITMITSRTGDKHRERASQIGIEHYLGKPYQEHELLDKIQYLIGIPETG